MFCFQKSSQFIGYYTKFLLNDATKFSRRFLCEQVDKEIKVKEKKKLSKAMKAYLDRAQAYNEFISKENQQFNTGKRHLANMMGLDYETLTQEQIDESVEYLFPSGLYVKAARPQMKPPSVVFPPRKDAQFDEAGRPFHFLFYTVKPNYYDVLHNLVEHIHKLNVIEDNELRNKKDGEHKKSTLNVSGSKWVSKEELEKIVVEQLSDVEYNNFLSASDRLLQHPYSSLAKDFIMKYRIPLVEMSKSYEIPKPEIDESGRSFITVKNCPRKNARADVTVRSPGTGLISINGKDIEYFPTVQSRNQILFPLSLTGLRGCIDVEATVKNGGETGQAGAIRWGISWALRSFVDKDMVETMRLAGLLTKDFRRRERKKFGQAKARKKYTWKKR